ncbi:hypothetical protein UG55_1005320 [Frankia sp. EI5c]|uniref:MFS transporter n=1 Tax=Frankia sp. EI5c TaxID=683316 RepID=UPI0007C21A22|nr:MFS transporter [Frankia sp. EI5c]OAA28800.1 hypothetical protein UG55_1005320 [Frankia sp. EI5c]
MTWQYVTWVAGGATVAALVVASLPLLAAAAPTGAGPAGRLRTATRMGHPGRSTPAATAALVILIALVTAELTFDDLLDPPAWARAGWALLTAIAATWLAAHGRELTSDADSTPPGTLSPEVPATPFPPFPPVPPVPSSSAAVPRRPAATAAAGTPGSMRMADPLSEQDDLVQTLVVASYALQMGDEPRARQALDGALRRSRATLDELVRQRTCHGFVRTTPAAVGRNISNLT